MTPNDLVALVARLKDDADYLQMWIDDGLETDFTMDPDGMRNQQKHFRDCAAAIEQLQAELLEYQQCLDAGIEHRMRRKAETEAESLRAELAAVKADAERYRWLRSLHAPSVTKVPRIWSGPPWDETSTLWWEHGADEAVDAARAQAGGK